MEPTNRQLRCSGEDDIIDSAARCTNWEITKGKCFSLSRTVITDVFGNSGIGLIASLSTLSTSSCRSFPRVSSVADDDFELNAAFVPGLGCTVLYSFVSVAAPLSVHLPMKMNNFALEKEADGNEYTSSDEEVVYLVLFYFLSA